MGNAHLDGTIFGKEAGVILQSDIPAFLQDLAIQTNETKLTFLDWATKYPDQLDLILKKYL
jgi:sulfite reductase (ferredoxin)